MQLHRWLLIVMLMGICPWPDAAAQQVILNTNGEQIVIYPDGSWRYYEEADSVLLKKNLKKEELFVPDNDPTNPFEVPADNPEELVQLMRMASEFADLTERQQKEASIALANATGDKFEAEAQLEQANQNKGLVEPDHLAALEEAYDEKTADVKAAKRHLKVTTQFHEQAMKILQLSADKMEKPLSKLMAEHGAYFGSAVAEAPGVSGENSPGSEPQDQEQLMESAPDRTPVSPEPVRAVAGGTDRYSNYVRQPADCQIVQNQIDRNTRKARVVVQRELLFTHTDEELRPYFRQQELVTCHAQLSRIDDNVYLSVEFSIASPNARKNFGALEKGSLFRVKLLDRTDVNLYNLIADRGKIDPYSGHTLFVGQYLIEKDAAKVLSRTEVDKIRVVWSTGFEDYDVYDLDFFIDQFNCLQSVQ
ncbi:MAG: hypothetical protein R3301_02015 [Saprospiraceae bacterium]|nr:hypothetical protein [Saprospiraceae bacterium]